MAGIIENVKEMLTVKMKYRPDSPFDQYSRLFMVKVLMLSSGVVGLNWFSDKITCIVPGTNDISDDFVSSACWIQGFYVYENVSVANGSISYYGLPENIQMDGRYSTGQYCHTQAEEEDIEDLPLREQIKLKGRKNTCSPMKKRFFLQYQYMPFFLASLCILYYFPYIVFRLVNTDMMSLRDNLEDSDARTIVKRYFDPTVNSKPRMRASVFLNMGVKLAYIISNSLSFVATDWILYGKFANYGREWTKWARLSHSKQYGYTGERNSAKPGDIMLPTFGFCEVLEGALDKKVSRYNAHKFICEYSQHILYQYMLLLLWYTIVFGIFLSVLGFLVYFVDAVITVACVAKNVGLKKMRRLTLREFQYLEYMRKKDLVKYGDVIDELKKLFDDLPTGDMNNGNMYNSMEKERDQDTLM